MAGKKLTEDAETLLGWLEPNIGAAFLTSLQMKSVPELHDLGFIAINANVAVITESGRAHLASSGRLTDDR